MVPTTPSYAGHPSHPDRDQLAQFALGIGGEELEAHIAECETCCEELTRISDDPLGERLRRLNSAERGKSLGAGNVAPESPEDSPFPAALADHTRYRLIRRLGAGGMGVVYLAEHRLMQRPVALKVINPGLVQNPMAVERFRREVRAAAQLSHVNIVAAHDAEHVGDLHFLVMEFIDGVNLAEYVAKRGKLPVDLACHFTRQAAQGLQHASQRGMVHRDVKPQNLMLTKRGVVKILDLGLARLAVAEELEQVQQPALPSALQIPGLTRHGSIIGTPDYMAPEQVRGAADIDIRADIYSLGCVLYFLLTGKTLSRPKRGSGTTSRPARSPSLKSIRDDVPDELCGIIDRMTAADRGERFPTPAEVAQALAPFGPASAKAAAMSSAKGAPSTVVAEERESSGVAWYQSPMFLTLGGAMSALCLLLVLVAFQSSPEPNADMPKPPAKSASERTSAPVRKPQSKPAADAPQNAVPAARPVSEEKAAVLLLVTRTQFHAATVDPLRRALQSHQIPVSIAATISGPLTTATAEGHETVRPDVLLSDVDASQYGAVVFCASAMPEFRGDAPAGKRARQLIDAIHSRNGVLASVGNGVVVLSDAGVLANRDVAAHPSVRQHLGQGVQVVDAPVIHSGNVLTARDALAIPEFAAELDKLLADQGPTKRPRSAPKAAGKRKTNSDNPAQKITASADDLSALSDEFDKPQTLADWKRVFRDEGGGADQLEQLDIGKTRAGWLTMRPYTSVWYQDYRGELTYKPIRGDFVITTRIRATNRAGDGAPRSLFSLAGIMLRAPRQVTPNTWQPGGENYMFLSLGAADKPGTFQFEVKTTVDSRSNLNITEANTNEAVIRAARIGTHYLLLIQGQGGEWRVHRRYHRPEFPDEVQAGLTCYTDWKTCEQMRPPDHNRTVIRNGRPDLVAQFDYVRYERPQVPAALQGRAFSDEGAVSDRDVLGFLGFPEAGSGR